MNHLNLLPPDLKQHYGYARRNTAMLRRLSLFGIGLAGLVVIAIAGLIYIQQAADAAEDRIVTAEQRLVEQNQAEVEKNITEISSNLRLAVQVLSKEILFSKLLKQLAVIVPNNVSLSGLSINQTMKAIDITAHTTDYDAATQLQVNLADPVNKIFEKADVVNISCHTDTAADAAYPCTITIRALFAKNNSFLFINDGAGS